MHHEEDAFCDGAPDRAHLGRTSADCQVPIVDEEASGCQCARDQERQRCQIHIACYEDLLWFAGLP